MAAVPWKPLFWERYGDSYSFAGASRDRLAAVARDFASPLRGGGEDRALVRIEECGRKLAEASKYVAFMISALGTVEVLALRWMLTEDGAEVGARTRARAGRARASDAYEIVSSARGHLGAAGRLIATIDIHDHAVENERLAFLAAVEAATRILDQIQELELPTSGSILPGVAMPRADTPTRSVAAESSLVGTSSDATWRVLAGSVPAGLLRIALSGALQEIEAAQAALLVGVDAIDNATKVDATASKVDATADWFACYRALFRAFETAHAALSGLVALNNECAHVFVCCAPHLGLDRGGKDWRSWEASRADAERHGRAALDRLWSASAIVDYCFAGILLWQSASSSWKEARGLIHRAVADAGEARHAGNHLRHAAGREFLQAWMVLNGGSSS